MKINFTSFCHTSAEELAKNKLYAKELGFPRLGEAKHPHLAIVGCGPSVYEYVDTLRNWEGEIWAINRAWQWCNDNGIDATFCTADADPITATLVYGVKKAFVATVCSRKLFDELVKNGADIEAVEIGKEGHAIGPTTASAFLITAVDRGHRKITLFGCESSWKDPAREVEGGILEVECNGERFFTQPYLAMQAEILSRIIKHAPSVYSEKSGGLLRAAINDPEINVIAGTPDIHESIVEETAA